MNTIPLKTYPGKGRVNLRLLGGGLLLLGGMTFGVPPPCTVPVSTNPPAVLTTNRPPQMMLLTFDDAVNQVAYDRVQPVLTNHWNPNGDPIQATFFISLRETDNIDYWLIQKLHAAGHEIAVHTLTHTTGQHTNLLDWRREVEGCRHALSRLAAIPPEDIVGFRAPFLIFSTNSFLAVYEQGFWYDSSVSEQLGSNSHSVSTMIWPYTLHDGLQQIPGTGTPPDRPLPGLFEVPMWCLIDTNGVVKAVMDPAGTYDELMTLFQDCFTAHYEGNRAPMGIYLHAPWLETDVHAQALNDFIDWTLLQTGVWWVSTADVVEYMRAPVSADSATGFAPFASHIYTPMPSSSTTVCTFNEKTIRVCGPRPPDYPKPTNVFCTAITGAVGEIIYDIDSSWGTGCQGDITVNNTGTEQIVGWEGYFELSGATNVSAWNGLLTREDPGYNIKPGNYRCVIETGDSWEVGFVAQGTSPFAFSNTRQTLYRRQEPAGKLTAVSAIETNMPSFALSWEEAGYGYLLESSQNLTQDPWQSETSFFGDISGTISVTNENNLKVFRLDLLY